MSILIAMLLVASTSGLHIESANGETRQDSISIGGQCRGAGESDSHLHPALHGDDSNLYSLDCGLELI